MSELFAALSESVSFILHALKVIIRLKCDKFHKREEKKQKIVKTFSHPSTFAI